MPRSIRNIALIAALGFSLSACSHVSADPAGGEKVTVDMMDKKAVEKDNVIQAGASPLAGYGDAVWKSTDGAVEIFPLDSSATSYVSQGLSPEPRILAPAGKGISANENVEVFPLDNEMYGLWTGTSSYETPGFPSAASAIIYYAHGSVGLNQADRDLIKSFAQSAKTGGTPVHVEGHASIQSEISDPLARKIANLKISMDRAMKVSAALMKEGVPAERIETKAYGEERLPALVPAGKDQNSAARRVEIR